MSLSPRQLNELESAERWLAGRPTPAPSADSLRAVKSRIEQALLAQHASAALRHRRRRIWGAMAAAAAVGLAAWVSVEVARNTGDAIRRAAPSQLAGAASQCDPVDAFEQAADLVVADAERTEAAWLQAVWDDSSESDTAESSEFASLESVTASSTPIDRLLSDLDELENELAGTWES